MKPTIVLSAIVFVLAAQPNPTKEHAFVAVGVYMDDKRPDPYNRHVVGTWAISIDAPKGSDASTIQRLSQAKCQKTAPNGWRCAEMGSRDVHGSKAPCAFVALGRYVGKHDDGIVRPYHLWPIGVGYRSEESAGQAADDALKRASDENDGDPLVAKISVSVVCPNASTS